jgi:L-2-hydroxyglutarate oxidase LhgO
VKNTEAVIIGAGVAGLATAAELSAHHRHVTVIEQHSTFGQETSGRNSGVIHAGIYYPKNSLKARLCVEGNRLVYQLCEKAGVPCKRMGKLIVATDDDGVEILESHLERAGANGVQDLQFLSRSEIACRGPQLRAVGALHSPSTGVVDAHALMKCLEFRAAEGGVEFSYDSKVIGIEKHPRGYVLDILSVDGRQTQILCEKLINCAGLYSDKLAAMAEFDIDRLGYALAYSKGEYFNVTDPAAIPSDVLVYPAVQAGVGIHTLIGSDGQVKLGPNCSSVKGPAECTVDPLHKQSVYDSCVTFLPLLEADTLVPDIAGVSPRRQGSERDFIIVHEKENGFPGFVNLIAMDSPALTACLAIAKYVGQLL